MRVSYSFLLRWLVLLCLLPSYGLFGQTTVTIGTGTTTTTNSPIRAYYNYSYTQMIYTSSDITAGGWAGGSGAITKIAFYVNTAITSANASKVDKWKVYIGGTTKSAFGSSANTEYEPITSLTEVFNGTVSYSTTAAGWVEVVLSTPYVYTGGNIVIAVDNNSGDYISSTSPAWRYSTLANTVLHSSRDASDIDPFDLGTLAATVGSERPNLRLNMVPYVACSGVPSAGTVTTTPALIYAGSTFAVNASGTTMGSGLSYQWQQNTGSGWVNVINSPATPNYAPLAAQPAPAFGTSVDYRLQVTCVTTSDVATSAPITVTSTYCVPSATGTNYLNNIKTTGGIANLNYTASSFTAYVNNSSTIFSANAGSSLGIMMTPQSNTTAYFYGWVDWNNDGDFLDAGEAVFASSPNAYYYNGSFNIPASVAAGNYRARFASSTSAGMASCGSTTSGNFVDFTLNVIAAPICNGMPVGGSSMATPSAGAPGSAYTVNANGFSANSGLTFLWETRTNNGPWLAIGTASTTYSGLTGLIAPATIGTVVDFRLIVKCAATNDSTFSTVSSFTSATSYCTPLTSSTTTYYMNKIETSGGISNFNFTLNSYQAYSNNASSLLVSQVQGANVDLNIVTSSSSSVYYVWVDWNNDGDFADPGEEVLVTPDLSVYNGYFNIPGTAAPGAYRMRIGSSYTGVIVAGGCSGTGRSGNFVDATLQVIAATPCTSTLSAGAVTVTPDETGVGQPYNVTATGYTTLVSGLTFQWQKSDNGGAWTNVGSATAGYAPLPNQTAPAFGNVVDWRLRVVCSSGPDTVYSSVGTFITGMCGPTASGTTYLNGIKTTGGLTNLNYATSTNVPFANNVGAPAFSQYAGGSINLNITTGGTNTASYYTVWIDWARNSNFTDVGDTVIRTTTAAYYYNGVINIPASIAPGMYRVRFANSTSSSIVNPCGPLTTGTYVDYTLEVLPTPTCAGLPVGGTAMVVPHSAQPGSSFDVTASGFTNAVGLSYQWESNTNGGGWTSLGTPTANYVALSNQTAPALGTIIEYRLMVICTAGPDTAYSSVDQFSSLHCTPQAGGTSAQYYINSFSTTNGVTNFSYTANSYTAYVNNYTTSKVSQYPGNPINFNLTQSTGTGYFYVWVDWNNDGDFTDLGENVIATTSAAAYYNGIINVHAGQVPGTYRMRIATNNSSTVVASCGPAASGNFVDVEFEVLTPIACSSPIVGGTTTVSPTLATLGSNYDVTVTGFTAAAGLTFQWQTNTNNTGWVDYGNSSSVYSALIGEVALAPGTVVDYRLIVVCPSGPDTAYSSVGTFTSGYCTPTASGTTYLSMISTTSGVTNLNYTASSFVGYTNNSGVPAFSQLPGSSLAVSMTPNSGTGYYTCWIDWNNDGDFTDAGEQVFVTTSSAGYYFGNITISPSQATGNYRARFGFSTNSTTMNSCGPTTTGQFIDFTIQVLPPPTCAGTPNGGTVVVTPVSGQPGSNYGVASNNFTIEQGLTYEWQSSTNGGSWVSASAPSATYTALSNLVSPAYGTTIDYRLMIVCNAINDTAYSTVGRFTSDYCTPVAGTSTTYYIKGLTTTGSLSTDINYSTSSFTSYVNLSTPVVSQYPGVMLPLTITSSHTSSNRYYIWVDWDNDGIFSTSEQVYASTANMGNYAGGITAPGNQPAGFYRVRVALNNTTTSVTPCGPANFGSFVDFMFEVITAPACNGAPVAGTVTTNPTVTEVGASYSVEAAGFTTATGLTFQWQSSLNGGAWTNVGTATSGYASLVNQIAPAIGDTVKYRHIVTCVTASLSDTSAATAFASDYCKPVSTSSTYYINNFATTGGVANISNLNSGYSANGYGDFTARKVSHVAGNTINFTASFGASATSTFGLAIWVDWNNNGVFETTERVYNSTTAATSYNASFSIPMAASIGNHRMRVLAINGTSNPNAPCASITNGEGEDYTLEVLSTLNCNIAPVPTVVATANKSEVCFSDNVTFGITTSLSYLVGTTYQWEKSTDGGTTWTAEGTAGTSTSATFMVNATADYRLSVLCNGTPWATSSVVNVIANNPQVLSVTDSTRCGYGAVDLKATASVGASLNWYASATGGTPLFTGATFTTPAIANTTTYYVSASNGGTQANVGLANAINSGTGNSGFSDVGLMFDAQVPFVLQSVAIYPQGSGAGTVTIALKNSAGTVLQTTTVPVTSTAAPGVKTVVPLNFSVPAGTNMRLVVNGATGVSNLNREITSGFSYPYTLPGVVSITSAYTSGASSSYYYYFYDWVVSTGCESPRQPVVATVTTPVAATATVTNATICKGASTTVNVTSANPGYTYSWTPGNLTGASQTVSPTATTQYIVWATDNTTGPNANCVTSDTVTVTVDSVATPLVVATPASICSGEDVNLTSSTGYATGNGASVLTVQTNDVNPFWFNYDGRKTQYLITAAELSSMGLFAGASINDIALDFTVVTTQAFNNLTVSVGQTTQNSLTTTLISSLNAVYTNASFVPVVGLNTFAFGSALTWDGSSNIVVQFCWSNGSGYTGANSPTIKYQSGLAFNSTSYYRLDGQPASTVCAAATASGTLTSRPIIKLGATQAASISYNWTPGGATTPNITVNPVNNGTAINNVPYTLTVTNSNNGCSSSATVSVEVKPAPIANIASAKTVICSDDTQGFFIDGSTSVNAGSYNWNNGVSSAPSLLVTQPGMYYLEVSNSFNCTDVDSINIVGVHLAAPHIVIDHITSTEAILNAGAGYDSYLWNTLQSTQIITVLEPGTYTVTVTDENGCTAVSEPITINKISVEENEKELSFSVFPNPSNGLFNVKFDNFMANDMVIKLIDVTGRTLQVQQLKDMPSSFVHSIDASNLADGNYFIRVETKFGFDVKQIIVVR